MKMSRSFFFHTALLSTSLKCVFERSHAYTGMSIAQSSRESTVACKWVFISDFHEFFFIPLDRRGIQPSATTVATCRFNIRSDNTRCLSSDCKACERSRTCAKLNASYTNRRNAILIAIYCQNQSANFRGVYRSRDITIYTRYLMKIFKKCVG